MANSLLTNCSLYAIIYINHNNKKGAGKMLTKKQMLRDLERWYRESGDGRYLYLIIGLKGNRLSVSEAENKRHEIQHPDMYR